MKVRTKGRSGFVTTPREIVESDQLDCYEFRLGVWLSSHTEDFCGEVSQRQIARTLGMGNNKTESALRKLEALGVVEVVRPGPRKPIEVTFDRGAWESIGLTPTGSELTPTGSVADPHRVSKEEQGGEQEKSNARSSSSTPPASKQRQRDPLWDALVAEMGPVETKAEQSRRAKVVAQLRATGATAGDVRARCAAYRKKWPRTDLTDTALMNHWSKFAAASGPPLPAGVTRFRGLPCVELPDGTHQYVSDEGKPLVDGYGRPALVEDMRPADPEEESW